METQAYRCMAGVSIRGLIYALILFVLIFPSRGICYEIGAQVKASAPYYEFSSASVMKNIEVSTKIYSFLEIFLDYQTIEWVIPEAKNYRTQFSAFSLRSNEHVAITFSGIEDLKPSVALNEEKGIPIPEEAINSHIKVTYSLRPVSVPYLSPENLNDKSFIVPFSEEERKFHLFQKLELEEWNAARREGTYPYIWHEDPEGFIITVTVSP